MCDPVSEHDSRGGGFYCCQCNRWFRRGRCCVSHRGRQRKRYSSKKMRRKLERLKMVRREVEP